MPGEKTLSWCCFARSCEGTQTDWKWTPHGLIAFKPTEGNKKWVLMDYRIVLLNASQDWPLEPSIASLRASPRIDGRGAWDALLRVMTGSHPPQWTAQGFWRLRACSKNKETRAPAVPADHPRDSIFVRKIKHSSQPECWLNNTNLVAATCERANPPMVLQKVPPGPRICNQWVGRHFFLTMSSLGGPSWIGWLVQQASQGAAKPPRPRYRPSPDHFRTAMCGDALRWALHGGELLLSVNRINP
jgi:hypothetical protein